MRTAIAFLTSVFFCIHLPAQKLTNFRGDNKLYGFKDKSGKIVVQPKYNAVSYFSDGVFPVKTEQGWGYMNDDGIEVIAPQFEEAGAFKEGMAAVGKKRGQNDILIYGYIDKTGKLVLDYKWEIANPFKDGFAIVGHHPDYGDYYFGVINKKGEEIIPQNYTAFEDISEGRFLAATGSVRSYTGKYGFLDATGKVVIPFEYENGMGYHEGLASVQKNGKYGFIDKAGKVVIPFQYDGPSYFEKGKAEVAKDGKMFNINKLGKKI